MSFDHPPAPVPERPSPTSLHRSVEDCRACDLWEGATQAVMGEGAEDASLMLVGEQPGDREDIEGHPFVGPAGRVLDTGLERAGITRDDVYITNVVKHFRYKLRGSGGSTRSRTAGRWRRASRGSRPSSRSIRPEALVCLGATAAQALLGSHIRIGRDRGRPIDSDLAELVTLTTHPSAILRADDEDREQAMDSSSTI